MDIKDSQARAWAALSKEAREELLEHYEPGSTGPWEYGYCRALHIAFGEHNVSYKNIEQEEMLMISKSALQKKYETCVIAANTCDSSECAIIAELLEDIFGSDCVSNKTTNETMKFDVNDVVVYHPFKTDSFYDAQVIEIRAGEDKPYLLKLKGAENIWAYPVEVQSIAETYPTKPKYKEGDKVFQKKSPHIWRTITKVMDDGTYVLDSEIYDVTDDDIEPYIQVYKEDESDIIELKVGDEVIANIGRPVPAKILKILDNGFVIVSYQDITKKVSLNNITRYEELCGDESPNEVENKEDSLNLIEFLQGHEGESFYCLLSGKDVKLNSVNHNVIFLQIDDDHIVNLLPEGTAFKGGLVLLYPSYALYEKYPLNAEAAWNEWKKEQTPKRWRAKYGERYWYVKDNFEVTYAIDRHGDTAYCGGDDERYTLGNYFQTDKEAQYAADAFIRCLDKVHEELLKMRNDYNTK